MNRAERRSCLCSLWLPRCRHMVRFACCRRAPSSRSQIRSIEACERMLSSAAVCNALLCSALVRTRLAGPPAAAGRYLNAPRRTDIFVSGRQTCRLTPPGLAAARPGSVSGLFELGGKDGASLAGQVDTCPPANLPLSAEQAPDAWQKVGLAVQANVART